MKAYYKKAFGYVIFFYPLVRTLVYPLAPMYILYGALYLSILMCLCRLHSLLLVLFYERRSLFPLRPSCNWPIGDEK